MAMGTINLRWLKKAADFTIKPDMAILLNALPATAINRIISRDGKDSDAYDQQEEIVRKIIECFIKLADGNDINIVSTDCDITITLEKCVKLIDKVI